MNDIKSTKPDSDTEQEAGKSADVNDEELNTDKWLAHTLRFEPQDAILAKDASTKKDDWHDIYDPRNPLNKRKRGEDGRHEKDRHRHRK